MSLTCGFYDAIDHDRKYNSVQMSSIFDGVINDGVYMSIGDHLAVSATTGMTISIGIGRAWFNHTWTLNDALMLLTVSASEVLLNRIDAVVLEVNNTESVRTNSIKIVKGTPDAHPVRPTLTNTDLIHQHALAYISVEGGVSEIRQADITNMIGTTDTPFVTGIIDTIDITTLIAQWEDEWNEWLEDTQSETSTFITNFETEMTNWKSAQQTSFTEWQTQAKADFRLWEATIHDILDSGAAGHLQNEIDAINENINQYGDLIALNGWNQLVKNGNFVDDSEWRAVHGATLSIASNKATVVYTDISASRLQQTLSTKASHKYMFSMYVTPSVAAAIKVEISRGWVQYTTPSQSANQRVLIGGIMSVTSSTDDDVVFQVFPSVACTVIFEKVMLIDLTTIYGSGKEPLTVDDFRRLFTRDFYEYHIAGSATNADTLDGKHASDFTTASGDGFFLARPKMTVIPNNVNLNTYTIPGSYGTRGYDYSTNITNSPFGTNPFSMIVESQIGEGSSYFRQTAKKYNSNTVMTRTTVDNGATWTAWTNIADGGNASSLGGVSASSYLQSSQTRKVLIQSATPSDTSVLWVDTSE